MVKRILDDVWVCPSPSSSSESTTSNVFTYKSRLKHITALHSFVLQVTSSKVGGILMLLGPPGTGKTSTATEYLSALKQRRCSRILAGFDIPARFTLVQVDGDDLKEESNGDKATRALLNGFQPRPKNPAISDHVRSIKKRFGEGENLIVFIDEADALTTIRLRCKSTLLDFFVKLMSIHLPASAVVLASNDIQLEATVKELIHSYNKTHSVQTLYFEGYDLKSLIEIANDRGLLLPSSLGTEYGLRKVANSGGDCRQALDFLARIAHKRIKSESTMASSIAKDESIQHSQIILSQILSSQASKIAYSLKESPLHQQLIICALCQLEAIGDNYVDDSKLLNVYRSLLTRLDGDAQGVLTREHLIEGLYSLQGQGLVTMRGDRGAHTPRTPSRSRTPSRTPCRTPTKTSTRDRTVNAALEKGLEGVIKALSRQPGVFRFFLANPDSDSE